MAPRPNSPDSGPSLTPQASADEPLADEPPTDQPLNKEELAIMTRKLAMLSPQHVAEAYRRAHTECCLEPGNSLPKAAAVQELVTAWKLMRAWRGRRGG